MRAKEKDKLIKSKTVENLLSRFVDDNTGRFDKAIGYYHTPLSNSSSVLKFGIAKTQLANNFNYLLKDENGPGKYNIYKSIEGYVSSRDRNIHYNEAYT